MLNEVRESVTMPDCIAALADGLEREFTWHLELHKPLGAAETEALESEQAKIEYARRQIADAIKADPTVIAFMKPEIERLSFEAETLKRRLQQAKPAMHKGKIKDLVARGITFYQERVLGPMEAMAQDRNSKIVGKAKPGEALGKGEDATAQSPEVRPCTAELKELLRLLDVKLAYDPDRKEGKLEFSPFR